MSTAARTGWIGEARQVVGRLAWLTTEEELARALFEGQEGWLSIAISLRSSALYLLCCRQEVAHPLISETP